MNQTYNLSQKSKHFLLILLPIMVTQVALFAMSFFDTIMSGHAGANDLAGVAIATSIWAPVFTGLNGILLAVTPIVAQMIGAQKKEKVPYIVFQGIYLGVAIALSVIVIGIFAIPSILGGMKLEPEVHRVAQNFLLALAFGIIPLFVYTVLRCFIDALGETRVTMFISLISLPINVVLNYLLIFGKFGLPRLGGVGAGVATAITYWIILVITYFVILRVGNFREYGLFSKLHKLSFKTWGEILKLGLPIGFSIFFETSIFAAVTLLMSRFDTITIAAHQVAMNFASFLYMIPMSIAMALTIVVGHEVGAKRMKDARQYSFLGIGIAVALGLLFSAALVIFNKEVASLYTNDIEVFELAQHFLLYSIFFQLSDAVAAPIQGALRGYKDVNITFIVALISYWVIGLPLGFLLVQITDLGAFGYWIGLIVGLAVGAIFLMWRLLHLQRKTARMTSEGNTE
ncbi:MATE family efflux transporter [Brevibacillus sp. SKDU10]|uniref:MATE family efflux transporter n=1 Tax=Brevibacillus sp. SKDU10 TaxID=1247872 RepID=UPI0007C8A978|nr:MATE family efflux transporter [Brevibacillus sp. SKDU10]OAJ75955.1 MATE family efflux transporter [Brevibacillus sp. SKDU10]